MCCEQGCLLQGVRVLVADKHPDTLILYGEIFRHFGAEVCLANSALAVGVALEQFSPNAIITELIIDCQYIYDFLPTDGEVPIIVTTVTISDEERSFALTRGIIFYIQKPVEVSILVDTLRRAIGVEPILCDC